MAGFGGTCVHRQHKDETAIVYISSPSIFQFTVSQALLIYSWGDREARTGNNNEEELQEPNHLDSPKHLSFQTNSTVIKCSSKIGC